LAAWVTGTSALTCVGGNADALWRAAEQGVSGLKNGLGMIPDSVIEQSRAEFRENPAFAKTKLPESRSKELALIAFEQALRSAGWSGLNENDGLILATTTGQIPVWDKALTSYLRKTLSKEEFIAAFEHQPLGNLLSSLSEATGFSGRQLLISSACSASTQALAIASMWLEQGLVERCIVGGIEVLCDLTVQGFSCLQLLSQQASKPFDAYRSGINLAEGAAFLCLEKQSSERSQARLTGYGMTSDGYHMTAPHPEGKGCFLAMKSALNVADIELDQIDWIHAHGTGSTHNDQAEAAAIRTLYADQGVVLPWVSSSKWVHGHALGASGIVESVLCIEALKRQTILKTHGLETPDPSLALKHPNSNMKAPLRHILKNTLGFGGTNAALVWSQT